MKSSISLKLAVTVGIAAALWFYMFSPWTAGLTNFWLTMSCAAVVLTSLSIAFTPKGERLDLLGLRGLPVRNILGQVVLGVVIAFALWGVFWIGDKLSQLMFSFARPQVDNVYSMKDGFPAWVIALLLLFVVGPAEELFWRGFVQKNAIGLFQNRWPADCAFLLTTAVYALVHIWSFNFMLVMAALVAGFIWGFLYRLCPSLLPALIVSHALWDALVFIIMPI